MMKTPAATRPGPELVILTHEFDPFRGGVATYCRELAAALHREGCRVEVWAPDYGRARHADALFPVARLRAGGTLQWSHRLQFAREVARRGETLRSTNLLLASVGAHMACMFLESTRPVRCRRLLSLIHGSELLRFQRYAGWRALSARLFRRVGCVCTPSEFTRGLFRASPLGKIVLDVRLAPCAAGSEAIRDVPCPIDADPDRVCILTLARLHPRKGQLDVARALAGLPGQLRAKVLYRVAGTGEAAYRAEIERTCRDAGVACEFPGEIPEDRLPATYAACDIFAMTSRSIPTSVEGFGIAYLEAGFHRKPVVGYRSGGTTEAVIDGETGWLVEEGDEAALSDALGRLITDASLRRRLGEGGRRHAARFRWEDAARVVRQTLE